MIDWVAEAWNAYSNDLKKYLAKDEIVAEIEERDCTPIETGLMDKAYVKLLEIVITKILNKGIAKTQCGHIGTKDIKVLNTRMYSGDIYFILSVFYGEDDELLDIVSTYYYTTVSYGSCSVCDAMQYALSSDGDERTDALMRIALTMMQNMKAL